MVGNDLRALMRIQRFRQPWLGSVVVMAGVLASVNAANAAPIRDQDTPGDASRTTLIQFPKLSFSLDSQPDANLAARPLSSVADDTAQFDALAFHVPTDGLGDKPFSATDADSSQSASNGASHIDVSAAPRGAQDHPSPATVPEPASIVLIGLASLLLYFFGRRWSRQP
jgi:hypothetical protein